MRAIGEDSVHRKLKISHWVWQRRLSRLYSASTWAGNRNRIEIEMCGILIEEMPSVLGMVKVCKRSAWKSQESEFKCVGRFKPFDFFFLFVLHLNGPSL